MAKRYSAPWRDAGLHYVRKIGRRARWMFPQRERHVGRPVKHRAAFARDEIERFAGIAAEAEAPQGNFDAPSTTEVDW